MKIAMMVRLSLKVKGQFFFPKDDNFLDEFVDDSMKGRYCMQPVA